MIIKIWFALALCLVCGLPAEEKIIYMISPPRTCSVVFTRMLHARGDFEIYHEPTLYAYNIIRFPHWAAEWYKPSAYSTYQEVKEVLLASSVKHPTFVKEMSFAAVEFLEENEDFVKNPQVSFLFLVRDPHAVLLSFYKKNPGQIKEYSLFIGYEALFRCFKKVEEMTGKAPHIILVEELCKDPEKTLKIFCNNMGISFSPDDLHWDALDSSFDLEKEWHEFKYTEAVLHWHKEGLFSNGFFPLPQHELDENGKPTFSEVENPSDREEIKKAYEYCLPYYLFIKEKAMHGS